MNTNATIRPATLFFLLSLSMLAFAGNSIITRLALQSTSIDAISFTSVRIISAAIMLWIIVAWRKKSSAAARHNIQHHLINKSFFRIVGPPVYLFVYAACFTIAYRNIDTGVGALILFACVQLTMIGVGVFRGERLNQYGVLGLVMAFLGLMYLLLPISEIIGFINHTFFHNNISLSNKPANLSVSLNFFSAINMVIAGIAWGAYSLSGQNSKDSITASAYHFLYAVPLAILLSMIFTNVFAFDALGWVYAMISGAVISANGYIVWYKVLPLIRSITASVIQLSVPIIAAMGGIIFLNEPFTLSLVFVSMVILSGIALVIFNRR